MNRLKFHQQCGTTCWLVALLFVSFAGECFAADDPKVELDQQKAKIEQLSQALVARQGEFQTLQNELKQRQREAMVQQQQAETEYKAAMRQFQELQAQAAQAAANDRQVVVYSLQNLSANDAIGAISKVLNPNGDNELSIAIDERANRLIASGTEKRIQELGALLEKLDVATNALQQHSAGPPAAEMLQVRIIWLANPMSGQMWQSAEGKIDDRVLKALKPLGFPAPEIACQTVTSIVVDGKKPNSFSFTVPVAVDGMITSFQGSGSITPIDGGKYLLKVELMVGSRVGRGAGPDVGCQLEGSIATPLGNYTVLGTGVVVAPGKEPKQLPCAFVLQVNRTDNVSATNGTPAAGS